LIFIIFHFQNMAHHILLIGGHGKVAQRLTPLLLAKSWSVTSMIRTAEQKPAIEKLGHNQPGKLNVLVSSVVDVKDEADAKSILEQIKPDWVVWSAGMYTRIISQILVYLDGDSFLTNNGQEPAAKAVQK
jgi:dTDP-4-dehydrorhamnose reductase